MVVAVLMACGTGVVRFGKVRLGPVRSGSAQLDSLIVVARTVRLNAVTGCYRFPAVAVAVAVLNVSVRSDYGCDSPVLRLGDSTVQLRIEYGYDSGS